MISFTIPINPPRSTSQGKRMIVRNGRPVFFKKREHQTAEDNLLLLCSRHAPSEPLKGPLSLSVEFVYPWRKSETKQRMKAGRQPHTTIPDCDNAVKLICDVLTKLLFYCDDSHISDLRVRKWWGDDVGITIQIESPTPR